MSKSQEWLYGLNPVKEALKSDRRIRAVYVSLQRRKEVQRIVELAERKGIPIEFKGSDFFHSRFPKGNQGIVALAEKKALLTIEELLQLSFHKEEPSFFFLLDCIEDPRNFGAILRVAEAVGVHGVVFQSRRSVGLTDTVLKASSGAYEYVNLVEVVNIKHAIERMRQANITIIGAEADSSLTLWELDLKVPLALVVGSEGKGLRRTVRENCDFLVRIPMKGRITSLNVSMAAGILSYEVLRQRLTLG